MPDTMLLIQMGLMLMAIGAFAGVLANAPKSHTNQIIIPN